MIDQMQGIDFLVFAMTIGLIAYVVTTGLRIGQMRLKRDITELKGRLEALEAGQSDPGPGPA